MDFEKLYIGGQWTAGASGRFIEVENPATRQIFARVPAGNEEDVDKAARAAHGALPAWAALPLTERIDLMEKFLAIFKSQENDLIDITIKELGSPYSFTKSSQVEYQYTRTRSYIDLADQVPLVEHMAASTTYREPVGVVGCVTPWNYPLGQVIQKVVPALLMGNTLFGGSSNSKLFLNVREKLSLCYYASSLYHRQKGLITVSSGIEFQNYQRAYDEIMAQLEAVQKGELEDWELEGARSTLLNSYATVGDSQGKLENFYLGQAATGQHETPADLARAIQNMTAERICRAMSTVKLDTVYFLKGKEGEA